MSVSQQRTRKQVRQSVGVLTGKIWQDAGALESAPSETAPSAGKIIDQNLAFGYQDEHRGKWVFTTDSNSSNDVRRVLESDPGERSINLSVPLPRAADTAWTYEMWAPELSPTLVHEFMNQSITEADRKGVIPLTSDSFHTGGSVNAFGLSSTIAGIRFVEWRRSYVGEQLTSLDSAMTAGSNSTVTSDSENVKEGSGSNKIVVAAAAATTETVATATLSDAVNLSGYTHIQFWVKSNVTTTSSNFRLALNDTAANFETVNVPALNADSWTHVSAALTTPETETAITLFIVQTGASDGGSATLYMDDVVTYRARAEEWVTIPREFWGIDKQRRELRISKNAGVPYAKLQVTGVQKPALPTTDTSIIQVDPQYVVNATSAKAFRMMGDDGSADRYEALAQQQRNRMNTPSNIRWVED